MKKRAVSADGTPIRTANDDVPLDSRAHEVGFSDGQTEILTADIIAENSPAEVDPEGDRFSFMEEIEDHRKTPDAIPKSQGTFETSSGVERKRRTTRGWEFLVRWKGGSSDWAALEELKESHPIQVADHAMSNNLQEEPAFTWWTPCVNEKRKAIVQKVKSKCFQRTHKHGLGIPKT